MKRLLMGLMLLVTATAASAEWTIAGLSDIDIRYVDRATIRRNGNFVKMWDLSDYKAVQTNAGYSYLSSKTQWEFDCKEERLRVLAFSWYSGQMGHGIGIFSNSDTQKWEPSTPESMGEILGKIECGKQ